MIALALLLAGAAPVQVPVVAIEPLRSLEQGQPQVETWDLDQVRIPPDTDQAVLKLLEPLHTLEDVTKMLTEKKVPWVRGKITVIPNNVPDAVRAQILQLPPGEPFVMAEPRAITISVLIGRKLPPGATGWAPRIVPAFPASSVSGA